MSKQRYRIVDADRSEIHDEPHIEGRRITVLDVQRRVEERGDAPETVADRFRLDLADVYEALAYYRRNPEEMRALERRREETAETIRSQSLSPPDA